MNQEVRQVAVKRMRRPADYDRLSDTVNPESLPYTVSEVLRGTAAQLWGSASMVGAILEDVQADVDWQAIATALALQAKDQAGILARIAEGLTALHTAEWFEE